MACNCGNHSGTIRDCPPFANKMDVINALEGQCGCFGELTTAELNPIDDAVASMLEAFPNGMGDCCQPAWMLSTDNVLYWSDDLGQTWDSLASARGQTCTIDIAITGVNINNQDNTANPDYLEALDANCKLIFARTDDDREYVLRVGDNVGDGTLDNGEWYLIAGADYPTSTTWSESGFPSVSTGTPSVSIDATRDIVQVASGLILISLRQASANVGNVSGSRGWQIGVSIDGVDYWVSSDYGKTVSSDASFMMAINLPETAIAVTFSLIMGAIGGAGPTYNGGGVFEVVETGLG